MTPAPATRGPLRRGWLRSGPWLCLLALVLAAPRARAQSVAFLHAFELVNPAGRTLGAEAPLQVTLELNASRGARDGELVKRLGAGVRGADGRALTVPVGPYPAAHDGAAASARRASFVLDYDEAPVRQARAEALRALGARPEGEALARWVAGFIHKKSLARGFDPASVVARRREGDCTEHAVLLAALARAFGAPARVVLGLVLVEEPRGLAAYGHAWVEVRGKGGWVPHDAALDPKVRRAYVPMNVLEDEGPGFGSAALTAVGVADVRRLVIH